jgi:hypothetical protein
MVSAAVACLPAAVSQFMQISGASLALTWPLQALFAQSSPVCEQLLQAFPFPSTLGEVTLHPLSQACMFVYSSRGKWDFPPLLWSFPLSATLASFPCWACASPPAGASPARPGLFIYSSGKGSPPPLFSAQGAPPSLQRVFILIAYYSVSLFSWVEVSLSRGLCCSGPGLSVGVPQYHEAHLVFPSHLGVGDWWPRGPPGFSI